MSKTDDIVTKLQDMTQFIEQAQDQLKQGEVINLSHLDNEVAELCNETLRLPPQEAMKVQPIMAKMISKLEELGIALKDFQAALKQKTS